MEWFADKYIEAEIVKGKPYFIVRRGKMACSNCFRNLYFLNKNFYYKWISKFEKGAVSYGYRKGRSQSKAKDDAMLWLEDYGKYRGDLMPDKEITMLPYKTRKVDVHTRYTDEVIEMKKPSISKTGFYTLWRENFRYLKIKKVSYYIFISSFNQSPTNKVEGFSRFALVHLSVHQISFRHCFS